MDLDRSIGFWAKGLPYVWSEGDTIAESRRFYLIQHDACAVFNEAGQLTDIESVQGATFLGQVDPTETFSLVPVASDECPIVRNCFLVLPWTDLRGKGTSGELATLFEKKIKEADHLKFPYATTDIRIEGESVSEWQYGKLETKVLSLVHPEVDLQLYPAELGRIPITKVRNPIFFKGDLAKEMEDLGIVANPDIRSGDRVWKYNNLQDVSVELDLTTKQLEYIHDEAVRCPQKGWCYSKTNDPVVTKLVYETILAQHPIYWVKTY